MADRYASLKQGLVGCWIPSVSGSGLLLPDLSMRGNNGSLVNMDASDWVSASYGRALDFDGSDDYVDTVLDRHLSGSFSICCWVKLRSLGTTQPQAFVNSQVSSYSNYWFNFGTYQNALSFALFDGSNNPLTNTFAPQTNRWYFFCGVRDISKDTIADYVDGRFISSVTDTTTITPVYSSLTIGAQTTPANRYANAQIDDIRIYNRALTESEIKLLSSEPGIGFKRNTSAFATRYAYKPAKPRNYSVIRNRDPNYSTLRHGLVAAYCPSISGQGNVLPDLVGGNHGTLTNMTADDWVSSGDGRALDFDGVDDSVKSNRILPNLTPAFTLSLWVYVRSLPTSGSIVNILSTYYSTGSQLFGFDLRFRNDAGIHKLGLRGGDGTNTIELGSDEVYELPTLKWINLLFTVTSSGAIGYQDSIQIATYSTMRGVPMNASKTLSVGSLGAYSSPGQELGRFFNGVMDDIRIYNRALTEPEIKLLASKRGIGLEPRKPKITFADLGVQKTYGVVRVKETDYATLRQGLVGAWCPSLPNGGSGSTLPDVSGYNNHGSLVNMGPEDWVSGQYGRALRINRAATRDQVNFGNVCHQPNDFSVSFFVNKIATGSTAYQNLWAVTRWNTGASMGTNEFCCLLTKDSTGTGDEPSFVVDIAGTGYRVESSAALRLGFFDHVCCVRLADTLSIYVNSINRGTTTGVPTTAIANNSRNLKLGDSDIASTDLSTNAMFNDIRIYNRALTESEIKLLASRPGIGLRQESHRNTFYQFPSFQPALARRSSAIIGGGIT